MRLKRLITNNPCEPSLDIPYPSRTKNLARTLCLPVMKGLLTVLLSPQGACSVDFFVLICKVRRYFGVFAANKIMFHHLH